MACVIIYALNCGLGVVGLEMTMDFDSTKWNRCLVRGLPTDSPLLGLGLLKTVPIYLLDRKCLCVICMNLLKMNCLNCVEINMLMHEFNVLT